MRSIRLLNLKFCRLKMFNANKGPMTTGWLCDNCVAFSRILPAVMSVLFVEIIEATHDRYNKDLIRAAEAMSISLFVMISLIMSPTDVNPVVIDHHVKVFLSCCYRYEQENHLYSDAIHFWQLKPNFTTLLVLSDQIEKYGPIRYANEMNNEREIQYVKPMITCMRKTESYFGIKMESFQEKEVLDLLCAKNVGKQRDKEAWYTSESKIRGNVMKIYTNLNEIETLLITNEPVVALRMGQRHSEINNELFVVYGTRQDTSFAQLIQDVDIAGKTRLSLWYVAYKLEPIPMKSDFFSIVNDFTETCLMIPILDKTLEEDKLYTVVCSSWKVKKENGSFELPELPLNIYQY